MGVLRAAHTTRHTALDHPARARCLTRHPRLRRRALACTCRQAMLRFYARKERKHAKPIAAQACPPLCAAPKALQHALCVKDMGVVVPSASAASDHREFPSWASVITSLQCSQRSLGSQRDHHSASRVAEHTPRHQWCSSLTPQQP